MPDLLLIPRPRHAAFTSAASPSTGRWVLLQKSFSDALQEAAERFAQSASCVLGRRLEITAGTPQAGDVLLDIAPVDVSLGSQRYTLTRTDGGPVRLVGGSEAALFWGLQTLTQLVKQTAPALPNFEISDWPDLEVRGYMLDVSRCKVPTMETLYRLVDRLAGLKYNQLQLYMEHTFAYSAHDRVWAESSPFTAQEILALDRYCRDRFIELVPNQNSFGHLERWLKFPEYLDLAECPDGYTAPWSVTTCSPGVLYPDEKALQFLDGLYDELLPNFSSQYFNIGCDETWELGQGRSKVRAEQIGKHEVYVEFLLKIFELVKKHGRIPQFWGDIVLQTPEVISRLPSDIVAISWGYEANHPFAKETAAFAESGIPYYVAPGTSAWNSLSGRTTNCLGNIQNAVEHAVANHGKGMLMTDWGDGGNHQYPPVTWLGITAGAALAWACEANRDTDWAKALSFYWADDPTGKVGEFLVALGHLPDCFEKPGCNATLYGLASRYGAEELMRGQCKEGKPTEVDDCLAKLDEVATILPDARPQVPDAELLLEELHGAVTMIRMGLLNLRRALAPADSDNSALRTLLLRVIGVHEHLWLARNRAGGLAESAGFFRNLLKELK